VTGLVLTKHHGLGNDFLVVFHPPLPESELPAMARAVCDRRTGIGADGLLVGESDPHHTARMVLYNADGSRPEMSGNGLRCFAQALALRCGDLRGQVIATDAGPRRVELIATDDASTLRVTAEIGAVSNLDEPAGWAALGVDGARPVAHLGLGNPHSVVAVLDVHDVDLARLGALVPHVNLEVVQPGPGPDAVTMRVHERGAGVTMACGTGACAAAVAAVGWGLAAPEAGKLVVHMDGGPATVVIDGDDPPRVSLIGPTTFVGTIELAATR
jgi:diaminopimelate epimerase